MANQVTRLSDLQIPTNFGETIAEASVTKSALFTSGVVVPMEGLAISKGSSLPIPFLKPLAVNPQTLADGTSIETRKLGTGKSLDYARRFRREHPWFVAALERGRAAMLRRLDPLP
jgi:hypothetical protein